MHTSQLWLLKLVLSLTLAFTALTGCVADSSHTAPSPSGASPSQSTGTLQPPASTPEPAAVPSPRPTGVPFTSAATAELPTTAPTLPGATPGPSVASDASGKEYDFTAVTAGYSHVCGLRSNGRALCWGRGLNGETEPPEGTFTSVSAGNGYTCGIKTDGSVSCWGIWGISYGMSPGSVRTHRRPEAPAGVFKSISAGEAHACGIKADDTLACWGGNRVNAGQATPPSGAFRSVSAGYAHSCGVTTNNLVVCWGAGYDGDVALPPGSFLSVSVGSGYSCGVKTDYSIVCWGSSVYGDMTPPAGRFSSVSASNIHACGVRLTGEVDCWGYWLTDVAPQGKFLSVSVAEAHRCAVGSDGAIACWGRDLGHRTLELQSNIICGVLPNGATVCPGDEGYNLLAALHAGWVTYYDHNGSVYPCGSGPDGKTVCWNPYEEAFVGPTPREVVEFSASDRSACWLLPDGTVGCWGRIGSPKGNFQSVVSGESLYRDYACGVRTNGELACWGDNGDDWGNVFPPEGAFKSVSLGWAHACAIKMDDTVVCWGSVNLSGRGIPSPGLFRSLGGGGVHSHCGIRPDDTLNCWGGLYALPGAFQSVSVNGTAKGDYYCGVRTDSTVACSGTGHYGETTPPAGEFQSVSAGRRHVCGVRVDGAVVCWGSNTDPWGEVMGQAIPPPGEFLSVSAGENYTCGIRTDHTLACWGQVPEVLQNLSGGIPSSVTEPEPTATPDIRSLPLRAQLDLEMEKPGSLAANVGGDVGRIYRFVGMMTEAEREAVAEETQLYLETLGPPEGKASLHTYARIWLDLLEAFVSPEKEFDDYYSISEYRLKVPFYVYMPAYLPPGFRNAGVGVSGGGGREHSTAWILHFMRSSETYPQLESGQEERITFIQSTNDQKGNPFREALDQFGGGQKVEFPNLEEAGSLDARYWVGPSEFGGQGLYVQVAWEDPEHDTFAHVISHLSLEETLKVIRSLR